MRVEGRWAMQQDRRACIRTLDARVSERASGLVAE